MLETVNKKETIETNTLKAYHGYLSEFQIKLEQMTILMMTYLCIKNIGTWMQMIYIILERSQVIPSQMMIMMFPRILSVIMAMTTSSTTHCDQNLNLLHIE